jgi:hypothetical protein
MFWMMQLQLCPKACPAAQNGRTMEENFSDIAIIKIPSLKVYVNAPPKYGCEFLYFAFGAPFLCKTL